MESADLQYAGYYLVTIYSRETQVTHRFKKQDETGLILSE